MEQVELKSCPFCGGEARFDCVTANAQHECTEWSPECSDCGATIILDRPCGKHDAAAAWNTRTTDQAKDEEIARLVEAAYREGYSDADNSYTLQCNWEWSDARSSLGASNA